eukprot:m.21442 g.21442  ORF g.21442 m.21442 type:complete len:258 (-) comp11142_c0_seq1:104-877(-)
MDVSLSLDALSKSTGSSRGKAGKRGGGSRGRGRGRGGASGNAKKPTKAKGKPEAFKVSVRNEIALQNRGQGRGRGRGRGRGGRGGQRGFNGSYQQQQRSMGVSAWPHDMYAAAPAVPPGFDLRSALSQGHVSAPGQLAKRQESLSTGCKVTIFNLDGEVEQDDIEELMAVVGPTKSCAVTGIGCAEVVFKKRTDALKAHQKYNQVKLDGRPMFIQVDNATPEELLQAEPKTKKPASARLGRRRGGTAPVQTSFSVIM